MNFKQLTKHIVVKNILYLGVGNGLTQLIGMIAVILITDMLLPAEYGIYTFMLIQAQLIATVSELGTRNIIIREVARAKKDRLEVFSTSVASIFISSILVLLLYAVYNYFLGHFTLLQLAFIGVYSLLFCLSSVCESLFIGMQKMLPTSLTGSISALVWLLFIYLYPQDMTIMLLFGVSTLLLLLKMVVYLLVLKYKERQTIFYSVNYKKIRSLIKKSLPYFGLVLVALPANYLSINFLKINSTAEQIGFFSLAQKICSPLTMLFTVLFSALFPNLSVLWEKSKERFKEVQTKGIVYFILIGAVAAFCFSIVLKPFFGYFFSPEYAPSINICRFQIWFTVLMGICNLIGIMWGAMNREKLAFQMAVVNSALNIPLLWLGSKYGGLGLSIAYVVSFSIFMLPLWYMFLKSNSINKKISYIWLVVGLLFAVSFVN